MNGFKYFIFRCLMVTIIFLILAIMCKSNLNYKNTIYNNIYNTNINFSMFRGIYNKYLSDIIPIYNIKKDSIKVFNENIKYNSYSEYLDGIKLEVDDNYLVPSINNGIVVYIGNKDNYGNVIIIEDNNGIDTWYGNICNINYKLYDNIEKGDYIGESSSNYIYLVYSKSNKFLDYREYFNN